MDTDMLILKGNTYFRNKKFEKAIQSYAKVLMEAPVLSKCILANLITASKRYRTQQNSNNNIRVGVCSWEFAHNAVGRAYILAQMYERFSKVELIGSIFPRFGREIWQPIRESKIVKNTFIVDDELKFVKQAIKLVSEHPYDIVHLSKPRASNIIFGILYKIFWNSAVFIDIDDEELSFVDAESETVISNSINNNFEFPDLKNLIGKEWTKFSISLVTYFDGVTVSNTALQEKYGGTIIRHARDETIFKIIPGSKETTRKKFGISCDKKIVLFFGTPLPHKGLYETAKAISTLQREDIIFLIVGNFSNKNFKSQLQNIEGCNIIFLDNQPFSNIPQIVSMADCCAFLQDDGDISRYQTPAKITDALAMGVPIICTNAYGFSDLNCAGLIRIKDKNSAAKAIDECLRYDARKKKEIASKSRDFFERNLSLTSQALILKDILAQKSQTKFNKNILNAFFKKFFCGLTYKSKKLIQNEFLTKKNKLTETESNTIINKKVGIIILNLNGEKLIDELFHSISKYITNLEFRILITDHGSRDNSKDIINYWSKSLPIDVEYAEKNYTFSFSNNRWAEKLIDCDNLLFLNNDIIFKENIIEKMLEVLDNNESIGVIGVDQIEKTKDGLCHFHHRGIDFGWDNEYKFWRPFNIKSKRGAKDPAIKIVNAVTGSVMMVRRNEFLKIGGFDEGYIYGYEDVDLCLSYYKLLNKKSACLLSNDVIHSDGHTRKKVSKDIQKNRSINNIKLLKSKFTNFISNIKICQNFESKVNLKNRLKIAFAVTEIGEQACAGDYFTALELGKALENEFNWEIEYRPKGDLWYELYDIDVIIAMVDAFNPKKIHNSNPTLIKVAWARNWFDRWCEKEWHDTYDFYMTSSQLSVDYILNRIKKTPYLLRLATNPEKFYTKNNDEDRNQDFVFIGSYWNVEREIMQALKLCPNTITGSIYGKNWEKIRNLSHLYKGFIPYKNINNIYQTAKIVIDDANHVTKSWGSVNSRVFDALASGCLVITNSKLSSQDIFGGLLPVYNTPNQLVNLMQKFINCSQEREILVKKLRDIVLLSHTYKHRAYEFRNYIFNFINKILP